MVKYCYNCGAEIDDGEHYCPKCGSKAIDLDESVLQKKKDEAQSKMNSNKGSNTNAYSNSNNSKNSNDAFNGPFKDDVKVGDFNGPFNRGSKGNNTFNGPFNKKSEGDGTLKSFTKYCCLAFVLLLVLSMLSTIVTNYNTINSLSDSLNLSDSSNHYTIDLGNGTYLGGDGNSSLVDSNYSNLERNENYTLTGYETYKISLENGDWYMIDVFGVKYNTMARDWYYNADEDDGYAYIFYNAKGDYYGYFINIVDSSNSSKYQSLDFLESIFHKGYE